MKYRKKPVVIEAYRYRHGGEAHPIPDWLAAAIGIGVVRFAHTGTAAEVMLIETIEGTMMAQRGDYVICGIKGELYPCKPDIFEATYEPVAEDEVA